MIEMYMLKPALIQAIKFDGHNQREIIDAFGSPGGSPFYYSAERKGIIISKGDMGEHEVVNCGDFVIRNVSYNKIFVASYNQLREWVDTQKYDPIKTIDRCPRCACEWFPDRKGRLHCNKCGKTQKRIMI